MRLHIVGVEVAIAAMVALSPAALGCGSKSERPVDKPTPPDKTQASAETSAGAEKNQPGGSVVQGEPNPSSKPDADARYSSDDHGFSVLAPSEPKSSTLEHVESTVTVHATTYTFTLDNPNVFAAVANMEAVTSGDYDINVGLDGAVSQGVGRMNGKMATPTQIPYKGRPARQFEFTTTWQGSALEGVGRAVGIEDRRLLMVFAVWSKGDLDGETTCRAFVSSFQAELEPPRNDLR